MDRNGCQGRSRNPAAREIDALVQRDASDDEFEPVWARLDAYDIRYDDGFNEVYPAYWPTSLNTRPMGNSKDPGLTHR